MSRSETGLVHEQERAARRRREWLTGLVARLTKILVPSFYEAGDKLLHGASGNRHAGVNDVAPCVNACALGGALLEADPLGHSDAESVVDPPYSFRRNAVGNHMIDDRIDRTKNLDLHSAARLPGLAVAPENLAIDIGEAVPAAPIAKDFPGLR